MEKNKYEGKQTIDCTPTWEGILPLLLDLNQNDKLEVRKTALAELNRMAKIADQYVLLQNKEKNIKAIFDSEMWELHDENGPIYTEGGFTSLQLAEEYAKENGYRIISFEGLDKD